MRWPAGQPITGPAPNVVVFCNPPPPATLKNDNPPGGATLIHYSKMTANITDFVNYLTDVACSRIQPGAAPPPALHLGDTITPSAFIMDVLRHVGGPQPITRHGVDDMMDIMLTHPVLSHTLQHATHIQEHFATTFLRQTSAVFQDHWIYIIVPAWNQLAHSWTVAQGYGAAAH